MKSICVFCGSSLGASTAYRDGTIAASTPSLKLERYHVLWQTV